MFVANAEKIVADYEALIKRKASAIGEIESGAREFAELRGYDPSKTEAFVAYVKEIERGGLSDEESELFEFLSRYVDEVNELVVGEEGTVEVSEYGVPVNQI